MTEQQTESTPESQLFRCPTCDTVYIATAKDNCGNCDAVPEPVEGDSR